MLNARSRSSELVTTRRKGWPTARPTTIRLELAYLHSASDTIFCLLLKPGSTVVLIKKLQYGHIRLERGLWREGEVNAFMVAAAKKFGHSREGDLC